MGDGGASSNVTASGEAGADVIENSEGAFVAKGSRADCGGDDDVPSSSVTSTGNLSAIGVLSSSSTS